MYSVSQIKKNNNRKIDALELLEIDGLLLSKKGYVINDQVIRNIKVVNKDIAHILAYDKVYYNYKKLISLLTDLLTSDDDSGDDLREALNQIERFRLEVKNKYRSFLLKKELEKMSKELTMLKNEAEKRLIEMNYNFMELSSGKSR